MDESPHARGGSDERQRGAGLPRCTTHSPSLNRETQKPRTKLGSVPLPRRSRDTGGQRTSESEGRWGRHALPNAYRVAQHQSISGRRFAPYPSAASDGGQKMRRSHPKALLNRKSIQWLHNGRRIFGGPSVSEGGRSHHNSLRQGNLSGPSEREGVTPAKQKPSLLRPLRAEPSKDRRSHNTKRRAKS